MSKQPPPAPTESTIGPCPTVSLVSRTPWHWKFTQHLRTTRPPPVLLVRIRVGQGPTALAVGAGGGCLDIFTLIYPFSPLSPSLWETTRYRLKYCLKGSLSPKSTNQPTRSHYVSVSVAVSPFYFTSVSGEYCLICKLPVDERVVGWCDGPG